MGAQNSPVFWSKIATETFSHIPKSRLINFIDDNTNHARIGSPTTIPGDAARPHLGTPRKITKPFVLHVDACRITRVFGVTSMRFTSLRCSEGFTSLRRSAVGASTIVDAFPFKILFSINVRFKTLCSNQFIFAIIRKII